MGLPVPLSQDVWILNWPNQIICRKRSFQHTYFVFFVLSALILLTLGILFMLLWFDPITSFPAPDKGLSVPANILFFGLPLPSSSSNPNSPESENRRHLEKSPQSNLIRSGRGVKVKVISRCESESNLKCESESNLKSSVSHRLLLKFRRQWRRLWEPEKEVNFPWHYF